MAIPSPAPWPFVGAFRPRRPQAPYVLPQPTEAESEQEARLGVVAGAIDGLAADVLEEADNGEGEGRSGREGADLPGKGAAAAVAPPNGDCSPIAAAANPRASNQCERIDTNQNCTTGSDWSTGPTPDHIAGLNLMERRLLTLFNGTPAEDTAGREEIQATLTRIRGARAELELKLSPT